MFCIGPTDFAAFWLLRFLLAVVFTGPCPAQVGPSPTPSGNHQEFPWNSGVGGKFWTKNQINGELQWLLHFPMWNLGKEFKEVGNCRLNHQQFPTWNPGTASRTGVSKQKGNWLKNQLERTRDAKRAHNCDEFPLASEIVRKDSAVKKGFAGTMPVFLIVCECHQKRVTLDPTTATKSVKSQNSIEYGEGDGREFQKGGDICIRIIDSCRGLTENSKIL